MEPPPLRSVLIGEFFGTLLLILLGDGVVASVQLLGMQGNWIVIADRVGTRRHTGRLRQRST